MGLTLSLLDAEGGQESFERSASVNQVLEWNQIFIDTLIATNTANSSSQRLGAIVHTAIFDAYNGIEQRYTPIFVRDRRSRAARRAGPRSSLPRTRRSWASSRPKSRRWMPGMKLPWRRFACDCQDRPPERQGSCTNRIDRGIEWGIDVAQAVLGWRATDGFSVSYPPFTGGTAVGQWRPTPPALGANERPGVGIHRYVRPGQQYPIPAWTTAESDEPEVHGRFQRR